MDKERLLEGYFENSLTEKERSEFNKLLAEDEGFSASFTFEKNLKKAITLNERADLKQKLKLLEEKKTTKIIPMRWFYVAASVVLLTGFSLWITYQQSAPERLFDSYYQTYPNVVSPTIRGPQSEDIQSRAFAAYDNGDYKESLDLFDQIYQSEQTDYGLFYKGLSQLELQQYVDAQASFRQFDFAKNNSFTPYFKWYLALTNLRTGETEEAKKRLIDLSTTENPMQEMAKSLLNDLE